MYGCTARDVHAWGGNFLGKNWGGEGWWSRKELGILEDYIPLAMRKLSTGRGVLPKIMRGSEDRSTQ